MTQIINYKNQLQNQVKNNDDKALFEFTKLFDKVDLKSFRVTQKEIESANRAVSYGLKNAINLAKRNIEQFHRSQVINGAFTASTS